MSVKRKTQESGSVVDEALSRYRSMGRRVNVEELQRFASWLITKSGLVVSATDARNQVDDVRLDLQGDARSLAVLYQWSGQVASLALSAGGQVYGSIRIPRERLPEYAKLNSTLHVRFSRPRCRQCGEGNPKGWQEPDWCRTCALRVERQR